MEQISNLVQPTTILAVFDMIDYTFADCLSDKGPILLLDGIQDPGNCGTIIRTADWFGLKSIIRTPQTADFYHPKVVQATMGSLNNIKFSTMVDLDQLTKSRKTIVGMDMNGQNLKELHLSEDMVFVMGSEGQGISKEINNLVNHKVRIPGTNSKLAESLNVGVAASILMYELSSNKNQGIRI
ncbi:MAG TPA: RNA methyltransferase [Saprospiraceae bacterium]|nr:RNA methyltransferase [Saprospiraceae bacterium]